ncbi:amidase [Myxococcaceae bacterium GXIMD 01537]
MSSYQRAPVAAPKLSGTPLRTFAAALESPLGGPLANKLLRDSGLDIFRRTPVADVTPMTPPLPVLRPVEGGAREAPGLAASAVAHSNAGAPLATVARFRAAYASGETDPVRVARRWLEARRQLDEGAGPRMGIMIAVRQDDLLAQAEASAARLRAGTPLSVLDGVPVVVKDELDQEGYPTTLGTRFLNTPARRDSTVVARLRAAGALLVGKANMHEIGIYPIGINPHHGATRNPYNRGMIAGGSSSGPAAAVAAGLSPISIGADGGGSIRIPAGLCGLVGLKATYGRISEHGIPPLTWTLGHVGPMGLTAADVAATYALIAGPDPRDPSTLHQPPVHLEGFERDDLKGLRVGLCTPYFEDADAEVVARCREVVRRCVEAGAEVVEVAPPQLNTVLWSHSIIILSEMASAVDAHVREDVTRFGLDARINLALGRTFLSTDMVHALRHRHALIRAHLELMREVDVLVTPTTAITAPPINERALPEGESDLVTSDALMRFIRQGNLTGFPAIAVPAGYDAKGLPVSCHFMGRPWEEHLLLRIARIVEGSVTRRTPEHHASLF